MTYSMKDIYSTSPSNQMTTNEQTIPESSEESQYISNETSINSDGQRQIVDKPSLWGALLLLVGVLFLVHFI